MRNLVNPVNAAFPGALAIAVLASPAASQELAPDFDFYGAVRAELLQAIKMPRVDALYGELGLARANDGTSVLLPMKWAFDVFDADDFGQHLLDDHDQWASSLVGLIKRAAIDADAFPNALDYQADSSGVSVLAFGDYTHTEGARSAF